MTALHLAPAPYKTQRDFSRLADQFRKLRSAWFTAHVAYRSYEQEPNPASPLYRKGAEDEEADREKLNKRLRAAYDRQTEELITGSEMSKCYKLAPAYPTDVGL